MDVAILVMLAYVLFRPSGPIGSRLITAFDGWRVERALYEYWPELIATQSRLVGRAVQLDQTIVEFVDYECPFCRTGASRLSELVTAEEIDVVIRHLPLEALHPRAREAAEAAICGERHGVFADAHASLLNDDGWLASVDWGSWAALNLGIPDPVGFERCMADEQTAQRIEGDKRLAALLGIQGTPGFVTVHGVFGGVLDDALTSLPVPALTLANGVLFASGSHPDPAVHELGALGGALFTDEEWIVMVDRLSMSLLFIHLQTGEVRSRGGNGQGPGEFYGLAPALGRGPDGPVARDTNQKRATFYSPTGDLLGTEDIGTGLKHAGSETFLGALDLDSGRALAFRLSSEPAQEPDGAVVRRHAYLSIQVPDSDVVSQVREIPTTETLIVRNPPSFPYAEKAVLFGSRTYWTKVGSHIVVADTDAGEIVTYDRAGVAVATMPMPGERFEVSEAQVEEETEKLKTQDLLVQNMNRQAGLPHSEVFDNYVSSAEAPPIDDILADWLGRLWVRRHVMPGDTLQHWTVWADNEHVFSVELPTNVVLVDALGRLVLLRIEDDFGVQQAVVRRIG